MPLRSLHRLNWINVLALFGVLMHAGLQARHAALAGGRDSAAICRIDGGAGTARIHSPSPGLDLLDGQLCLVCTGAVHVVAILPQAAGDLDMGRLAPIAQRPAFMGRQGDGDGLPPSNRGPPLLFA